MRTAKWKTGCVAVVLGALAGCQATTSRAPYSDNPLLMAREPLVQSGGPPKTVTTTPASPTGRTLPPVPSSPYRTPPAALSAAPIPASLAPASSDEGPTLQTAVASESTTAAAPISTPPTVEPEFVASAPPAKLPLPPAPPANLTVAAPTPNSGPVQQVRFDHAADYSWLQGEFDCHYRGYKELRFQSPSEDDAYGGKVRLVDDPRLAEFRPGDIIRVEGELVRDNESSSANPRFIIRNVRLIEKKSR